MSLMQQFTRKRVFLAAALGLACVMAAKRVSAAQIDCTNGITVPANTSYTFPLPGDVYYSNGGTIPCFVLNTGASVNMNNGTIECRSASCIRAATAESAFGGGGNAVKVSNGTISGPFYIGVALVKEVTDVQILDAPRAILASGSGLNIHGNSIINSAVYGISFSSTTSTDTCDNNYIFVSDGATGISASGTSSGTGPKVDKNLIVNYGVGISSLDTTKVRIRDNILTSDDAGSVGLDLGASGKTLSGNVCGFLGDDTDCQVSLPFVLP